MKDRWFEKIIFGAVVFTLAVGLFVSGKIGGDENSKRMPFVLQEAAAFGSFNPTGGSLTVGTEQPINSNTTGVNTGGWQATLSNDSYYWDATSTTSGLSQEIFIDGVELNNANKFIIVMDADTDNTTLNRFYQICDWVSSSSVDNATTTNCTDGGWRTLNIRRVAQTTATETSFTWHVYNGKWNATPTSTSNIPLDTPLSNFIRASDGRVALRAFSPTNCATCRHRIDYVNLQAVIDPVYMPSSAYFQNGTATTTYLNTINGILAGQSASDDQRFSIAGSATNTVDFSLGFRDVRTFPGVNTILLRAEYGCSTTGPSHRPKIWNYATTTPAWEYFSTSSIACAGADATFAIAKNNINVGDYLSSTSTILVGWETLATTTASVRLDQIYIMIGSVNTDSSQCEISFGTGTEADCQYARDLDTRFASTTGPATGANVWTVSTEIETSTMSGDYYGLDNDADANSNEQGAAANLWLPMSTPTGTYAGYMVGLAYATNFRSGSASNTIQAQVRDFSGRVGTGGWRAIGTTNVSATTFLYQDAITNGYSLASPADNLDDYAARTNIRIRTTASVAPAPTINRSFDFVMVAPQWVERPNPTPTLRQMYVPSGGSMPTGTEQAISSQIASGNTGSWRGTLGSDNYRWTVSSTASGLNQQLQFDYVNLNGANKLIIVLEHSANSASLARYYQICDFVSSEGVDNPVDSECTGGGWRTLNIRKAAITATTEATYTWHIYNGYWDYSNATNTPIITPLSNFVKTSSSNRVLLRAYSTASTAYDHSIDYARIDAVIDPVYMPSSVTISSGYATTSYRNLLNGPLTGQSASDDQRFAVAGTATTTPDFYFTFKNIRTYPGANAVLVRAEYGCSATGIRHRPKIWNFVNSSWEGMASSTIACSGTDAVGAWARNLDLSNYISGGTMRVGWDTDVSTTTASVRLDYVYAIVGSVNSNSSWCEVSFGSGTATDCQYTRELDTTLASTTLVSPASAWSITTERETTTMSLPYYPLDSDNDTTGNEYAASANLWLPLQAPTTTRGVATTILYAFNMRAGTTSQTMEAGIMDFLGSNATARGGWSVIGTTNAAATFGYQDSLTNGYFANTVYQYIDTYNGRANVRMRTSVASTTQTTRDLDFIMSSLQWAEASSTANSAPSVNSVVINGGNSIILNPNATTTVSVSYQVVDNDGCQDVFGGGVNSPVLHRSGVGSSCSVGGGFCYAPTSVTSNCATGISANVTSTFELWYYADATDASSSYSGEDWRASFYITDNSGATFSTTSISGVEVETLVAMEAATSSMVYPIIESGGDSGSSTVELTSFNVGNSSITIAIAGTALSSGEYIIPTSSQHFASATFTYGGLEQEILSTNQIVSGMKQIIKAPLGSSWEESSNPYPFALYYPAATAHRDNLYIFGGEGGGGKTSTVHRAKLDNQGNVINWISERAMPHPANSISAAFYRDYVYILGGYVDVGTVTSTSIYSRINSDGSLGEWVKTTPLPSARYLMPTLVNNGYIYAIGGAGPSGFVESTSFYAPINDDGSLGAWATTTPLPYSIAAMPMVVNGDKIYVIGGQYTGNNTSTVIYSTIYSNGTLGNWSSTAPLPQQTSYMPAFVFDDNIYVLGGYNFSNRTSTVLFSKISNNGSIGNWNTATPLLASTSGHFALYHKQKIYYGFGLNALSGPTSTMWSSNINSGVTYFGLSSPAGFPAGNYTGSITLAPVFSP